MRPPEHSPLQTPLQLDATGSRPINSADCAWPEVSGPALVLLPVGSTEQHGPHLPLHTDTTIAEAVAHGVAARCTGQDQPVFVAPPLAYGASGEHQGFAGTMSIGHEALRLVLVELVRSVSLWAERIVIVSGHGGNVPMLADALPRLANEQHDVSWVPCTTGTDDAHAGHTETSLMLHLAPNLVDMLRAVAGNTTPVEHLMPRLMEVGIVGVSRSGVLGDPREASAALGKQMFDQIVHDVHSRISHGHVDRDRCLQRPRIAGWTR